MTKPWRTPKRKQKETGATGVQAKCVDWARQHKWWARKFTSPSNRSVPDYLFAKAINGAAKIVAVEFKRPRADCSDNQKDEQRLMREAGWDVYVIDDVEAFKVLFRSFEQQPSWLA